MEAHTNRNRKAVIIIIVIIGILVVLAGAWYLFQYKPEQEAKEKARLEQIAKAEAEKKRKELAAQKKVRYDQLLADADDAFNQENWQRANSLYGEAAALFPKQTYPKDQLVLVKEKLDEIAALETQRSSGIVETVSSATGRYYVLVSSSIDDDLAMDYASKLAREGNNVKVIEHSADKLTYYGVSLGDYGSREQAESAKASFSSFGNQVWVLEY